MGFFYPKWVYFTLNGFFSWSSCVYTLSHSNSSLWTVFIQAIDELDEQTSFEAEAMDFLYSLKWLRDISIQGIIIEVDCLQLVQAMRTTKHS